MRIVLSELNIVAENCERTEEIAMEIYEGDAHTKLHHGLSVECCEADNEGPSNADGETEM